MHQNACYKALKSTLIDNISSFKAPGSPGMQEKTPYKALKYTLGEEISSSKAPGSLGMH